MLASEDCADERAVSLQVQSLHSKYLIALGGLLTLASMQGGHVQASEDCADERAVSLQVQSLHSKYLIQGRGGAMVRVAWDGSLGSHCAWDDAPSDRLNSTKGSLTPPPKARLHRAQPRAGKAGRW